MTHSAGRDDRNDLAHGSALRQMGNGTAVIKQAIAARGADFIARQRSNIFLWMPVSLGGGIALYFTLKSEPTAIQALLPFLLFMAGLAHQIYRYFKSGSTTVTLIATAGLTLFTGGFALAYLQTHALDTPLLERKIGYAVVEGRVADVGNASRNAADKRLTLDNLHFPEEQNPPALERIRIRMRDAESVQPGDIVRIHATLLPPSAPVYPGAYDFRRHMFFKNISAVGYGFSTKIIQTGPGKQAPTFAGQATLELDKLRQMITQAIRDSGVPTTSIISALMTGERGAITESDWDAMRHSGLAHLLAISGLHVGLIAGSVFFLARLCLVLLPFMALNWPVKKIAAALALGSAFFYMLIVGATVPTQRAMIMTGIALTAIMFDRTPISLRLVALAAIIILCLQPASLLSVSFQMSFAAVTALVAFYEGTRQTWVRLFTHAGPVKRFMLYLLGVCATTTIASLATMPFAAYHFQHAAFYSLLSNIIAVPVMTFWVMPLIAVSYGALASGIEGYILPLVDAGIKVILQIAHAVTDMPGSYGIVTAWPHMAFVMMIMAGLILTLIRGSYKWLACVPLFIASILIYTDKQYDILVSGDSGLIYHRSDNASYLLIQAESDGFVLDQWRRYHGLYGPGANETVIRLNRTSARGGGMGTAINSCDHEACRFRSKGKNISLSFSPYVDGAECSWADALIAINPVRTWRCRSIDTVVDRFDTWAQGAHGIYILEDDIRIETVAGQSGTRPWSREAR